MVLSPIRHLLRLCLLALLLLGGWAAARPVTADGTTHAGLVVSFNDGTLGEYCVDLGADGVATGEEVLRATGLDIVAEVGGMGAGICKIEGTGCNFPAESCWCECTMLPGEPCTYWAYHHLDGSSWEQSNLGASSYQVMAGMVEGWSWGSGTPQTGAEPPVRTFEQLCAAVIATSTPTPSLTATATATARPSATATAQPTNTPQPTGTLVPVSTSVPPTTAPLPATATTAATVANLPTATRQPPTPMPTRAATEPPLVEATNTPQPEAGGADAPTATPEAIAVATQAATLPPVATQETRATSTPMPTLAAPVVIASTPTLGGIAVQPSIPDGAVVAPSVGVNPDGGDLWLYAIFGLIVVGLVGIIGWFWYQQRSG